VLVASGRLVERLASSERVGSVMLSGAIPWLRDQCVTPMQNVAGTVDGGGT
jgi:hypothetical protein